MSEPPGRGGSAAGWLAVIDMQRVFAETGSAWLAPRFGEIVGPVRELVEAFRPRVTFTRFIAPPVPAGAWQRYYDLWPFALQPPDARIYELVDDFAADRGQTVDAVTFGKWKPELAERVGDGGRLVAADAGAEVQAVADACAGVNDVSHGQALDIMRLYGPLIEVVSLADVLV